MPGKSTLKRVIFVRGVQGNSKTPRYWFFAHNSALKNTNFGHKKSIEKNPRNFIIWKWKLLGPHYIKLRLIKNTSSIFWAKNERNWGPAWKFIFKCPFCCEQIENSAHNSGILKKLAKKRMKNQFSRQKL